MLWRENKIDDLMPTEDEFSWWVYFFVFFQNRQIHYFLKAIR